MDPKIFMIGPYAEVVSCAVPTDAPDFQAIFDKSFEAINGIRRVGLIINISSVDLITPPPGVEYIFSPSDAHHLAVNRPGGSLLDDQIRVQRVEDSRRVTLLVSSKNLGAAAAYFAAITAEKHRHWKNKIEAEYYDCGFKLSETTEWDHVEAAIERIEDAKIARGMAPPRVRTLASLEADKENAAPTGSNPFFFPSPNEDSVASEQPAAVVPERQLRRPEYIDMSERIWLPCLDSNDWIPEVYIQDRRGIDWEWYNQHKDDVVENEVEVVEESDDETETEIPPRSENEPPLEALPAAEDTESAPAKDFGYVPTDWKRVLKRVITKPYVESYTFDTIDGLCLLDGTEMCRDMADYRRGLREAIMAIETPNTAKIPRKSLRYAEAAFVWYAEWPANFTECYGQLFDLAHGIIVPPQTEYV